MKNPIQLIRNLLQILGSKNFSIVEGNGNVIIQGVENSEIRIVQQVDGLSLNDLMKEIQDKILALYPERTKNKKLNSILLAQPKQIFGREEEIERISNILSEKSSLLLVSGVAGIGKSVTAYHYYNIFNPSYAHVAWFNGSQNLEDKLITDLKLHKSLGIFDKTYAILSGGIDKLSEIERETILMFVEDGFKAILGKVLFIIDDCSNENFGIIKRLQSSLGDFHFLITSRNKNQNISTIELGVLKASDARNLFYNFYDLENNDDCVDDIITILQGHTLLVELVSKAAARGGFPLEKVLSFLQTGHIEHKGLQITVDVNELKENREFGEEERIVSYIKILLNSILTLSLDEQHVLSSLSVLPNFPIEREKLFGLIGDKKKDNLILQKILKDLEDKGYIQSSDLAFQVHSLVGTAAREHFPVTLEDKKEVVQNATELIRFHPIHGDSYKSFQNLPIGDALLKYLPLPTNSEELQYYGELQNQMGRVHRDYRNLDRAIKLLEGRLYLIKVIIGEPKDIVTQNDIVHSLANLALAYSDNGDFEKARDLLIDVLDKDFKLAGSVHPATLSNLGKIFLELGQYEDARQVLTQSLDLAELTFGKDSFDAAHSLYNLGHVYQITGNYQDALVNIEKAHKLFAERLGQNHLKTIKSAIGVAAIHAELGNYQFAIDKLSPILASLEGQDTTNPLLEEVQNRLGLAFGKNGNYAKAIELLESALDNYLQYFEKEHPVVVTIKSNLSNYYEKSGQLDKAQQLAEESLDQTKENFSNPNHHQVGVRLSNLALIYGRQGRFAEAISLFEEAIAIDKVSIGEDNSEMAMLYSNYGSTCVAAGQYEKGITLLRKAADMQKRLVGNSHPDYGIAIANFGDALMVNNEHFEALTILKDALKIAHDLYPNNHPKIMTRSHQVAMCLQSLGCYFEALQYAFKALKLYLELEGENHPMTVNLCYTCGILNYKMGLLKESAQYLGYAEKMLSDSGRDTNFREKIATEMLQVMTTHLTHETKSTFPSAEEVGALDFIIIAYKEENAEIKNQLLQLGLKGMLTACGEDHPYIVECYDTLAFKKHEEGDNLAARDFASKSYEILREKLGEDHPRTQQASRSLGSLQIILASQFFDRFREDPNSFGNYSKTE